MGQKKIKQQRKEDRENPILRLKYSISAEPGQFRAKELMDEGFGGADGLVVFPFICEKDGSIRDTEVMSMHGFDGKEVKPKELFKLWVILSSILTANEELEEKFRAFCANTYMQFGIYMRELINEKKRVVASGGVPQLSSLTGSLGPRPSMTDLEAFMAAADIDPIGALSNVSEEDAEDAAREAEALLSKIEKSRSNEGEGCCGDKESDGNCSCGEDHSGRGDCDC